MIEATYTGPERVECRGAVHIGPNAEGDLAGTLIGAGQRRLTVPCPRQCALPRPTARHRSAGALPVRRQ
jgi:hypothetical protein